MHPIPNYSKFKTSPKNASQYWHAINLVALGNCAKVRGISLSNSVNLDELARQVITIIEAQEHNSQQPIDLWAVATKAESYLALREHRKAIELYLEFVERADTAFELRSAMRQLIEIWGLSENDEPGKRILPAFKNKLLGISGAVIQVTKLDVQAVQAYREKPEALLDGARPIPIDLYVLAVERAKIVVRLSSATNKDIGTGFVVSKNALNINAASDELVLVTNYHVANEVAANLDVGDNLALIGKLELLGETVTLRKILWLSPASELDLCVVSIDPIDSLDQTVRQITVYTDQLTPGVDQACIIGHPNGRGIEISITNNEVTAVTPPLINYRTPTESGNSGSPVFLPDWRLIGVHRAAILDGKLVTANQGVLLADIQTAIANNPMAL